MQNQGQKFAAAQAKQQRGVMKDKNSSDAEFEKMKQSHNELLNNNPYLKDVVSNLIQGL